MAVGKRSIFVRGLWHAARGAVVVALVLAAGYFLLSKTPILESRASQDTDDEPKAEAKASVAGGEERIVKLDSEGQQKGGIETAAPEKIVYQGEARAYGVVLPLDRLTSLYNNAQTLMLQLKSAQIKLTATKTANARAQNLLKVFPTAAAQAEAAEAAYSTEAVGVEAAQAQIEALRNTAVQDWGSVLGQAIIDRSTLAENLVLRKSCLIQLTLQSGIMADPPKEITVTFGGGITAEAKLVSEATQADPKIPNVSFLYTIPASPGALAGVSVTALFPNGKAKPGVGIPPSAIIWQSGRAWMYVQAGAGQFERRPIGEEAAPTADGGYVLPAASWPNDKRIVIAGAQTLLSEESKSQMQSDEDDN